MYVHVSGSCNFLYLGHTSTIWAETGLQPRYNIPMGEAWFSCRSLTKGLLSIWFPKTGWLQCKTFLYTFPVAPEAAGQLYHHAWERQTLSDGILGCTERSVSQLLAHNPGGSHLQKSSFLRGRKGRGGDRLRTKDCVLPVNQSLLSALALSTQRQTTQEAAYSQARPGPFRIANYMMVPSLPRGGKTLLTLACLTSAWYNWFPQTHLAYPEVLSKLFCQWRKEMWGAPQKDFFP